jgi:hypothetical protein
MSTPYDERHEESYADYREPEAAQARSEKSSVLDELLPLPTTTTTDGDNGHHAGNLLNSLRRISSLAVIVGFLLGIAYVAMTTGTVDQGIKKAEVAWTKYVKLHGKVFEDMMVDKEGESSGMQVVDVPPVNNTEDDHKPAEIATEEESDEDSVSVEEYVWGSDGIVRDVNLDLDDAREDWSKYTFLRTLTPSHVDTKVPGKRVIFVGDVHGMYNELL